MSVTRWENEKLEFTLVMGLETINKIDFMHDEGDFFNLPSSHIDFIKESGKC